MTKMMKINKNGFVIALVLGGIFALTNCSSVATNNATANKSNIGNTAVVVNSQSANSTTDAAKTGDTAIGKIGIPECDDYVEKFEACVNTKVPEGQRANFMSSFNSMRESWKAIVVADNPQSKAALAAGCKQSMEASKKTMSSFACAW